ncbi:MAG: hypothetical protein LBR15_04240 [Methanobrevibacter sp.]|jgi:hypothetical protein|nr:hypothetical protein [Candidatus Methanovirga australis]
MKINVVLLKILCCVVLFGCVSVYSIDSDVSDVGVMDSNASVVMDNSSSIQSKLNELLGSDKDNVLLILKEGVYVENNISINIPKGKTLTIRGIGNVVIERNGSEFVKNIRYNWDNGVYSPSDAETNQYPIFVINDKGNLFIENITFKNGAGSVAESNTIAGAIEDRGGGNFTISNCAFENNKGITGAISSSNCYLNITKCDFKNNHGCNVITMLGASWGDHETFAHGGAICNFYGHVDVHECNFELNHADGFIPYGSYSPGDRPTTFGDDIVNHVNSNGDGFVNASNNFFYGGVNYRTFAGDLGSDYLVYWPVATEPFRRI